jgi:hypothetical protein
MENRTQPNDEPVVKCEPAEPGDGEEVQPPADVHVDERTPEEAGYGYGV